MGTPTNPRGATNGNQRGGSEDRRRRREWIVETYRANVDVCYCYGPNLPDVFRHDLCKEAVPACRCYRCGTLLTVDTVTVDRIIPGALGGTYRRDNIRPSCAACAVETGNQLRHHVLPGRKGIR